MLKWLAIAAVVLIGFIVVLLGIGTLLVDNKDDTTLLKQQLHQQALAQNRLDELKRQRQNITFQQNLSQQNITAAERSLQKIITTYSTCQTNQECVLFDTHQKALGCTVAINTQGASLLIKINAGDNRTLSANKALECVDERKALATDCINNQCAILY